MVGPSFSPADRDRTALLLKVVMTVLVGLSAALVAVQGRAATSVVVAAGVAGLALGGVLTWFVSRNLRAIQPEGMRERIERDRREREAARRGDGDEEEPRQQRRRNRR